MSTRMQSDFISRWNERNMSRSQGDPQGLRDQIKSFYHVKVCNFAGLLVSIAVFTPGEQDEKPGPLILHEIIAPPPQTDQSKIYTVD